MPQTCRVCIHPERETIDAELTRDWERGLRAIGAQYGVSKDSLNRHAQKHLPQELEDSPATATAGINSTEKSGEARQLAEVVEQKKSEVCDQKKEPAPVAEFREEKKEPPEETATVLNQEKPDPWALWSPAEPEAEQTEKTPKKEPDAEVRYRAFIGHWRDRMGVWQHEPAEWSFDNVEELIEAAISRGDLMVFGSIYVRTVQLWLRFRA